MTWFIFVGWCAINGKKKPTASLSGEKGAEEKGTASVTLPKHPKTGGCFTSCAIRGEIFSRIREQNVRTHQTDSTQGHHFPAEQQIIFFLCVCVFIENMKNWQLLQNGGDKWKVEEVMAPHPNQTVRKNFVTSYM